MTENANATFIVLPSKVLGGDKQRSIIVANQACRDSRCDGCIGALLNLTLNRSLASANTSLVTGIEITLLVSPAAKIMVPLGIIADEVKGITLTAYLTVVVLTGEPVRVTVNVNNLVNCLRVAVIASCVSSFRIKRRRREALSRLTRVRFANEITAYRDRD